LNPVALIVPAAVILVSLLVPRQLGTATRDKLLPIPPIHIAAPEVTKQLSGEYPATVARLAGKWGKIFNIPVSWIRSQAFVESSNVPTALNKKTGMYGVLQLKPSTAEWLVKTILKSSLAASSAVRETLKLGWTGQPEALFNPDLNIMLAAYYMTLLRKKFGDDHSLVAAAYDMGPTKLAAHLDKGEPLPEQSMIYVAMVEDAKKRGFR
jgi:soluble lytic murein transglycosylase-like protein